MGSGRDLWDSMDGGTLGPGGVQRDQAADQVDLCGVSEGWRDSGLSPSQWLAEEGGDGERRRAEAGSPPPTAGLSWLELLPTDGMRVVRGGGLACARVRVCVCQSMCVRLKYGKRKRGCIQLQEAGRLRPGWCGGDGRRAR